MTKLNMKDAGKQLDKKTGMVLTEAERVKRNADILLQMLQQQEYQFARREDEEASRQKRMEQQQLLRQQTKAWTMPDEEPNAPAPDAKPDVKTASEKQAPAEDRPVAPEKVDTPVPVFSEKASEEKTPEKPAGDLEKSISDAESKASAMDSSRTKEMRQDKPVRVAPQPGYAGERRNVQQGQQSAPRYGRPTDGAGEKTGYAPRNQGGMVQSRRPAPCQPGGPRPIGERRMPPRTPGQGPYGRPANAQGSGQRFGRPAQPGMGFQKDAPQAARTSQQRPRPRQDELVLPMEKERVSNYDPNKKNYQRPHDPEHVSKGKRQLTHDKKFNGMDDDVVRGGKRAKTKKLSAQQMMAPIRIEKAVMTAEMITVKDLTEKIGKPAGEILKKLLLLGNMANINSELDYDTASLVCSEFDVELELKLAKTAEDVLLEVDYEDDDKDLESRPPVITIMGHVDHGKTSLLDHIRTAHVTSTEAGGITQHIGAYSVSLKGQRITFLDTPGHEAFTAMRARGAQSTDIAVLVVAADDGVMPQTVEAINHAKAAKVPIIVAINKMDKDTANPERIKQDLTAYNLVPEEWGGDTIMVPVSAKTGMGVDNLLEMILLQAEVLQLKANPDRLAKGIIIEAKLDKNRGPLATVLLQNGTLHVGDNIVAGMAFGRVRALHNDRGERVQSAGPSMPVEISGFDDVPQAGDEMMAVEDDKLTRQVAEERKEKLKEARVRASGKVSLDTLFADMSEGKVETLNIIVKADVQGSAEAVCQALEKLSNEKITVKILHSGVGAITKDDVNLASAFNAIIIGFNIRPDSNATAIADKEEVDIRLYRVIYAALEDVEKAMKGMLAPTMKEVILGHAQVRSVFKITGAGTIAGSYVTDGKVQRNASVRLLRDNVVINEGKLSSLRRFKDDVKEVAMGYECGIGIENYNDIKENDVIECFSEVAEEE